MEPSPLKRLANNHFPRLASTYRDFRDRKKLAQMSIEEFPYGFSLLGGNYLAAGFHEPQEMAMILPHLDAADILIDCGANSGLYTCLGAKRGKLVMAIEPISDNLTVLYKNIVRNRFLDRVEVFPLAVSDKPGLLPIFGRGQGASLLRGWAGQSTQETRTIPVTTLDRLFADRFAGCRTFLKIDVEGAEMNVLHGGAKLLMTCFALLVEISLTRNHLRGRNAQFKSTIEFLWNLGYEGHTICDRSLLITPDLIDKWLRDGCTGLQSENFLFLKSQTNAKAPITHAEG